jgi:hypothetical protein
VALVAFHPNLQQIPPGTKVKVFALPTPRPGELARFVVGNPETWAAPLLTKVSEPEVNASGVLEVAMGTLAGELTPGHAGLVAAEVAGTWRYLTIRTNQAGQEPL